MKTGQDVHAQDDYQPVTPSVTPSKGVNVVNGTHSLVTPDNKRKDNPNDDKECVFKRLLRFRKRILHALSLKFRQEDEIDAPINNS